MRFPNFAGSSYESQALMQMGARSVNLYREVASIPGSKAQSMLCPCPGLLDFSTPAVAGGRAIFPEESGRLFAIMGNVLYEVDSAGTATALGAVAVDTNPAQMAANGNNQLLTASGGFGKLYNLSTGTYTAVLTGVTMVGMVDTFFLALDADTGIFKISEASDGTTWDAGQVTERSAASDPWIAMIVIDREIFFFGAKTGEAWFNNGGSPFPFALRQGAFWEDGIDAPWSLAPFGSSFAWLGGSSRGSGRVFVMNGYTPSPISNEALEWAIQTYKETARINDAIGWSYDQVGHSFYVLEFPSAGKTWVYDSLTSEWHERGLWDVNDFLPYRARFQASIFQKNIVLDSQTNKLYALSTTTFTDVGGAPLRRLRRLPHLSNENRRFSLDYAELECQRGVGLTAGQGVDPLMMFRCSWDGGATYGNERTRSLGKKGAYSQRVIWEKCGNGRDLVMEFSCTEPVPTYMIDLYVGIS